MRCKGKYAADVNDIMPQASSPNAVLVRECPFYAHMAKALGGS
jgi:hypothetical protein